jgi:hypothetical protein
MATEKEELESLKIRVNARQGNDRITIIDHAAKSSVTCTVFQGFNILKDRCAKSGGVRVIHIVDHKSEKKRKAENPERSTRMVINAGSPEAWSALQLQKDRYVEIAVDPSIGILLMIRALQQQDDETLREWLREGHQQENDRAPDVAEPADFAPQGDGDVPDWLK